MYGNYLFQRSHNAMEERNCKRKPCTIHRVLSSQEEHRYDCLTLTLESFSFPSLSFKTDFHRSLLCMAATIRTPTQKFIIRTITKNPNITADEYNEESNNRK